MTKNLNCEIKIIALRIVSQFLSGGWDAGRGSLGNRCYRLLSSEGGKEAGAFSEATASPWAFFFAQASLLLALSTNEFQFFYIGLNND